MKIIVTGARDWTNRAAIERELKKYPKGTLLVHGACPTGADAMADAIGRELGFEIRAYPADWEGSAERGNRNAAGPIRNSKMVRDEHPDKDDVPVDKALAFSLDLDRSRGTKDCVKKLGKAGIPVFVIKQ